jgi:hypothetical protein
MAAAGHIARRLLDHLMDMNDASCPWMPRVKDLTLLGPMGVLSSRCTIVAGRIRALTAPPPITPTSPCCRSARQPDPGRRSTYRRGKVVQTTGATSFAQCRPGVTGSRSCKARRAGSIGYSPHYAISVLSGGGRRMIPIEGSCCHYFPAQTAGYPQQCFQALHPNHWFFRLGVDGHPRTLITRFFNDFNLAHRSSPS